MQPDLSGTNKYETALAHWVEAARKAIRAKQLVPAGRASIRAQVLDPGDDGGLRISIMSATHLRKYSISVRLIRRFHILAPNDNHFLLALLESYIQIKNAPRARAVAQRMLVDEPTRPDVLQRMGRASGVSGDRVATLRAFKQLLWSTGGDARIYEALTRVSFALDRFEDCVHWANRAIEDRGENAERLFWRGRAERMLCRTEAAALSFDAAIALDPSYAAKRQLVELTLVEKDFCLPLPV